MLSPSAVHISTRKAKRVRVTAIAPSPLSCRWQRLRWWRWRLRWTRRLRLLHHRGSPVRFKVRARSAPGPDRRPIGLLRACYRFARRRTSLTIAESPYWLAFIKEKYPDGIAGVTYGFKPALLHSYNSDNKFDRMRN